MANARTLPQSLDAERSLLGAILIDNEGLLPALEVIGPDDFSRESHRIIFAAMQALWSRTCAIDTITLCDELQRISKLDKVGGIAYVGSLNEGVPRSLNVEHYARIVRDKSVQRQLIMCAETIKESAYEGKEEVDEIVATAERRIFEVAERKLRSNFSSLATLVLESATTLTELYEKRELVTGLHTGFVEFDEMTTGLHPGEFIIIAARPSMGKTAFSLCMLHHSALKCGKTAAFFSLEMSKEQISLRMICSEARVNLRKLRSGYISSDEEKRIREAIRRLTAAAIFVDDSSSISTLEIRSKARRLKAEHGLDLIVIDYLQLLSEPGYENRNLEISAISRSLKGLAKELEVPVVALSQLSRATEGRKDHRPQLSDLRESGSLEQDADVVAFLLREEVFNRDAQPGVADLIIGKQRNGPTGSIKLAFLKEFAKFENLEWKPPE